MTPTSGDFVQAIGVSLAGEVYVTGISGGVGGGGDFATVAYTDYLLYTAPPGFTGTDAFTFTILDQLGNAATGAVLVVVLPPSLQFNTAQDNFRFTPGGLRLQVDGARGTNAVILYASTNLMNWQSPVLGTALFLDTAATNQPKRFYRATQLQ